MKKTFKFVVSATMEWPESEMTEQRAHDYILSAIRDCYLNKLIEDGICDCDAEIESIEVEDAGAEALSSSDRSLAMRQMEQELIDIVREYGYDNELCLDDLYLAWTHEFEGECYTRDITDIFVENERLVIRFDNGASDQLFNECDRDDLGHNLADYIYNEIKTYY